MEEERIETLANIWLLLIGMSIGNFIADLIIKAIG